MKKFLYVCVIALTAVAVTGCGKKATTRAGGDAASTSGTAGTGTGADGAYGAGSGTGFAAGSLDDPSSPLSQRKIYFGLDRYDVSDEYRALVEAHAGYLRGSPSAAVTLEGHTDERGSREYNLALGQKRAEAVRRSLALLGVSESQMEPVSFGEEKPAAMGMDETSYAKNRRVEMTYR